MEESGIEWIAAKRGLISDADPGGGLCSVLGSPALSNPTVRRIPWPWDRL